jgi:ribose-phosphate pyrophosphokinase
MQIFSGSANKNLATAIATELGLKLGEIEISRFANDEARILVKEGEVDKEVTIIQSLSQPTDHHLVEFCLIIDALKRMGAKEITAVIPWLGYSKQDKVFRVGEPLSVKVVANILQTAGLEKIITFDLHNLAILGFFEIPVVNLSARDLFLDHFRQQLSEKTLVVAPDAGSVKGSTAFALSLGVPVAYADKKRDLTTGEVTIVGMSREVRGMEAIIIDDMVVTGGTIMKAASYLQEAGVESIRVAATHHLYVPGVQQKLDESAIKELVVTDTIKGNVQSEKLRVLSIAKLIAAAIKG